MMTKNAIPAATGKAPRRKMTFTRQLARLGVLLAGAYLFGVIVATGCINRIMYHPPRPASYSDGEGILKLTTADGTKIAAMHLQNPAARYTILYSHGNGEDMGQMEPYYRMFDSAGYNVLAYDYHGYGTSEGSPSEEATYADIDAAYDYLVTQAGVEPSRILVLGRSLGSGPATDLAMRKPVGGLILESSFTSAFRVATRWPIFPRDRYRNLEKLPNVHCPVLFIHGRQDNLLPFWHAEKNFHAANEPKQFYWVESAGHNNLMLVAGTKYFDTLKEFVSLIESRQE
ncbi:MAG: alpha/beta hydrolase [Phycisphaerae bacterium]|nr:alpha/beta hydrolase [Phycisphaerae bacterium]